MRIARQVVVVLVLGFSLVAPLASASPGPQEMPRREARGAVRSFFAIFDELRSLLAGIWSKEGCRIDPLGGCSTGHSSRETTPTSDASCVIDPLGGCASRH